MTYLEKLAQLLLELCHSHDMPRAYQNDVSMDISFINQTPANMYVWLIRESGTNIMPIGQGVDPAYIEYYLDLGLNAMKVFLVNTSGTNPVVKEISKGQAAKLIHQQPLLYEHEEGPWGQVKAVLETGIACGWWGVFYPPKSVDEHQGLEGWLRYFQRHENRPMVGYLKRALSAQNRVRTQHAA